MNLPQKSQDFWSWNFNTLVTLGSFLAMFVALGVTWGIAQTRLVTVMEKADEIRGALNAMGTRTALLEQDNREEKAWRDAHEAVNKERRGEIEASMATSETAIRTLDDRQDQAEAQLALQAERQAAADARWSGIASAVSELQKDINDQGGDLKVIRAWIDRQEPPPTRN